MSTSIIGDDHRHLFTGKYWQCQAKTSSQNQPSRVDASDKPSPCTLNPKPEDPKTTIKTSKPLNNYGQIMRPKTQLGQPEESESC
jgi:hypothetical protein